MAVVIGHEIGHTIRGHFTQAIEDRDRTVKIIGFAGALLGIAAGAAIRTGSTNSSGSLSAGGVLAGTVAAMAVGAGLGFTSFALSKAILEGYAQENEFEADEMDVAIVRGAGYDPRALISLMKKFAYLEQSVEALRQKAKIEHWKQETTHFLNAKPGLTQRAARLERLIGN